MDAPTTHVIVTAPGMYFDREAQQEEQDWSSDDVSPDDGMYFDREAQEEQGWSSDDVFHSTRVIGPFPSRTAACEYADTNLDGQSWRVDTIEVPRAGT